MTQSTLYYYLSSKDALYEAVASEARKRLNEELIDPLLSVIQGNPSLESRLTAMVIILVHRAREDIGMHRLSFASDLEAHRSAAVHAFRDSVRADLHRLYCAVGDVSVDDMTVEREEYVAFIEMLTLGVWHFAIRSNGLERLPIFVRAFQALLNNSLFGAPDRPISTPLPRVREETPSGLIELDEGKREKLLQVGLHRFARAGYGKTSVKDLAADAGVTTGSIYHHFGSKAGLYKEVGVRGLERTFDTYRQLFSAFGEMSQLDRVRGLLETLSMTVYEHEDDYWMGVTLELDAARYPAVAETRDYWARHTERVFRLAVATEPDLDEAGWDRAPLLVLVLVLMLGGVCGVVRNGPGFLPVAIRGLQRFLPDSSTPPTT